MPLHHHPHQHLHGWHTQDEEDEEDGEEAVVVVLKAEWPEADLQADQGQAIQADQQAVTKQSARKQSTMF